MEYPVTIHFSGIDLYRKSFIQEIESDMANAHGKAKFVTDEPNLNGVELPFELQDLVLYPDGRNSLSTIIVVGHVSVGENGNHIIANFSGTGLIGHMDSVKSTGNLSYLKLSGDYLFITTPFLESCSGLAVEDGIEKEYLIGRLSGILTID